MMRLLRIAARTVTRRPLRTALTALSLILGVLALTSVAAAQDVMGQAIIRTALLTGGPSTTSVIAVTDRIDPLHAGARWQASLSGRYGPTTDAARVLWTTGLSLTAGSTPVADIDVLVVDPTLIRIRPFETTRGTWFGRTPATLAPALVLNQAAAQSRMDQRWTVRWGTAGERRTAEVIGVVDDGSPSPTAYLDLTQPGPWTAAALADGALEIQIHAPGVSDTQVRADLRQTQALAGLTGQTGDVRRSDTLHQLDGELSTTAQVFLTVAALALVVAAVGLLNIGLSTLAERADELSLRRAFGAHRRTVFVVMLLESQLVAVLAGTIAIALAWLTMPVALGLLGATASDAPFPATAASIGLTAGVVAAGLGSVVPAVRAVRTPIATIMRG